MGAEQVDDVAVSQQALHSGTLHLTKTCAGLSCTVLSSNLRQWPAGTVINYAVLEAGLLAATIDVPSGTSTATCDFRTPPAGAAAVCNFNEGTQQFHRIQADLVVGANSDFSLWTWDGPYSF